MAAKKRYSKQVKGHKITWSERQERYVIKKNGKQIYSTEYEKDAVAWVKRNTK